MFSWIDMIGPMRWLRRRKAYRVLVHTTEDQSIEGVMVYAAADGLVLRHARYHPADSAPISLHGETWIPREKIAFVQSLHPPA